MGARPVVVEHDVHHVGSWREAVTANKRIRLLALLMACLITFTMLSLNSPTRSAPNSLDFPTDVTHDQRYQDLPHQRLPPMENNQDEAPAGNEPDPSAWSMDMVTTEATVESDHTAPAEILAPIEDTTPARIAELEALYQLPEANYTSKEFPNAKIGKLSMLYGSHDYAYERALMSQLQHSDIHGYPVTILREKMMRNRLWTKPAFVLSQLLNEMAKPEDERLDWFFWFDGDTYLCNPNIPLEIFLPPPEYRQINFIAGRDHNGLNDGAFFIRVDDWSVRFFAASMTVETFHPEVWLKYSCQSGLEFVLEGGDQFRPLGNMSDPFFEGWAEIPRRWINAYMGPREADGSVTPGAVVRGNNVREGDLMVHFVGNGDTKAQRMTEFINAREADTSGAWKKSLNHTHYKKEIADWWSKFPEKQESLRKLIAEKKAKESKEAKPGPNPLPEPPKPLPQDATDPEVATD